MSLPDRQVFSEVPWNTVKTEPLAKPEHGLCLHTQDLAT